jgi:phosphoglycolate phosphatase
MTQIQEKLTPTLLAALIAKSSFTHILFDLDGTLIDSAPGIIAGFSAALLQNGVPPLCELSEAVIGPPLDETLRIISGISNLVIINKLADSFKYHYDAAGYKNSIIFEGVTDMLYSLHASGYTLHIATNKRLKPTLLILEYFGWSDIFTSTYALDSAGPRYTNKIQMLSHQLDEQGIVSKTAVYVGDSKGDRIASEKNNLHFIQADWGYSNI